MDGQIEIIKSSFQLSLSPFSLPPHPQDWTIIFFTDKNKGKKENQKSKTNT